MAKVSQRAKRSICWRSGVFSSSISPSIAPMRPISADCPVATVAPTPRPAATSVPENAIEARSPSGASRRTGSTSLTTATDSPVSAASCTRRPRTSSSRRSAGTRSPASSRTTSPGTSSPADTVCRLPSRKTEASAESIARTAASAFSARPSCQ